jgi:hypothetical protein
MNDLRTKKTMNHFSPLRKSAWTRARILMRPTLGVLALIFLCMATPTVHAQWKVVDKTSNDRLKDANDKLEDIKNSHKLGSYASPGDRVPDPQQDFASSKGLEDGIEQCDQYAKMQLDVCKEIIRTQNAEYMYMVTMYKNTAERNDRLKEILDERNKLQEADFGKLEDNTNKLTALYALMALDRQQMESTVYAYQSRLHYLESQQTQLANSAITGKPATDSALGGSWESITGSLLSGAALKLALDRETTTKPDGMQVLSSESSNGY